MTLNTKFKQLLSLSNHKFLQPREKGKKRNCYISVLLLFKGDFTCFSMNQEFIWTNVKPELEDL